ncbi:site-specific DNA-methyltransferase [Bartonella sp. DGB2]|uniref:site-specific DNA-methyltransferase n=1 Tax=Bartonella sp. DGB2 TaxID=3388426 RepID=UPI00398FC7D5
MSQKKQRLELTWIGKDQRPRLEPRILLEEPEKSYHAEARVSENDIFDNKLIFGDNLLALKALEADYAGKVKCIYIDPPYNTGNAFEHYDDGLEHSTWLSLMRDRLELLWLLLKEDGYLAVQIDDNEYARLYVLMCELFGESKLKTICVKMSEASGLKMGSVNKYGVIPKLKEYIILAKKDSVKNIRLDPVPKYKWDTEYNIYLENFSRKDKQTISEIALSGSIRDNDLNKVDAIAQRITLLSVAQKIKELGLKGKEKEEWLFENAFRICQCATSESVLKLANLKKEHCKQEIFFVANSKNDILYMVRANYSEESKKPRVQLIFAEDNLTIHPGDLWTDIKTTGLEAEGGVEFKNGKKPEQLVARIIKMATNPGDLVLDSFLGSGTTAAVAHKMKRRWIGIELGEHCETHCIPRLQKVIDGTDQGGISKAVDWQGGGGFRYYRLAPSMLEKDQWGQWVISKEYNAAMLSEAMCKHMGFTYAPDENHYWIHGYSTETDFIYVTTRALTHEQLRAISEEVGPNRTLLICCKAFNAKADAFDNLTVNKIPNAVLKQCEWGKDDYSLNVENLEYRAKATTASEQAAPDLFSYQEGEK